MDRFDQRRQPQPRTPTTHNATVAMSHQLRAVRPAGALSTDAGGTFGKRLRKGAHTIHWRNKSITSPCLRLDITRLLGGVA
jgi:hypothetical protein